MYGIEQMTLMDILYPGMNYCSKRIVDVAFEGAIFKRKSAEKETQLIEEPIKRNYKAPS